MGPMEGSVITLSLKLEAATKKDGDQWLAHCLPLDIFSQGDTKQKAIASLREAVELWFESCLDRDVLSEALAESGFLKVKSGEAAPDGASVVEIAKSRHGQSLRRKPAAREYIEVRIPAYAAAHLDGIRAAR